jgi:hypothetical protein
MKAQTAFQKEEEAEQETSKEKAKRLLKEIGWENDKEYSLPIRIQECELFDWDTTARMTLLVIAMGQRTNEKAWLPDDLPDSMREDAMGWCYFSQHRMALRVGKTEDHIQRVIDKLEKREAIKKETWTDSNQCPHDRYKVVEAVIDDNQRPSQKRGVERPSRYKVKRGANKGSFSRTNQPGMKLAEVVEDDE